MTLASTDAESLLTAAAVAAAAELGQDRPDYRRVVVWVSEHSAAAERVLYPAARRYLSGSRAAVQQSEQTTRRLEHVVFRLHQWLSGDGRGTELDLPATRTRLQTLLDAHVAELLAIAAGLRATLTDEAWQDLLARHARALATAPTRPHPHIPHQGPAERVAFRLASAVDRMMDVLESQPSVSVPADLS